MNFFDGNCCFKLNYFICGSKDFSSKTKKFNVRKKSTANAVSSNNKIVNKNDSSRIRFYQQRNANATSAHHALVQENSSETSLKCKENCRTIKTCSYECSLTSSIDDRSSSISNNEMIIKDVILHRSNLNERFGLTLSYGITSKSTTNIYIEQIEKQSLADYQGGLQRGDQIIQINNHRVTNRDQAIHLVNQASIIILKILRLKLIKRNVRRLTLTEEDDSGVILACNTDLETNYQTRDKKRTSNSLSCLEFNHCSNCRQNRLYFEQIQYRRCLSLNDFRNSYIIKKTRSSLKDLIRSQSSFQTVTDNENTFLKPLPFKQNQKIFTKYLDESDSGLVLGRNNRSYNISTSKYNRRRYREERLKEQNRPLITTDDEVMSELKQGRYWTRKQRKQQFQRSKQYKQRIRFFQRHLINSTTEDFNLLNRIFLRENHQELKEKPYLAIKYQQQSIIEKEKLKKILEKYSTDHPSKSQSVNSTQYYTSTII